MAGAPGRVCYQFRPALETRHAESLGLDVWGWHQSIRPGHRHPRSPWIGRRGQLAPATARVLLYGVANLAIAVGIRKITSSISLAMRRNPHNTIIEGDVVDSPDTSAHLELK